MLRLWLALCLAALLGVGAPASAEDCATPSDSSPASDLQSVLNTAKPDPYKDLKLAATNPPQSKAPASLSFPPEFIKGAQSAWDASMPKGKSQEQGGLLVRNPDGSYEWKAGTPGHSGSWRPNYGDVGSKQELIALLHTHPYDATEGGYTKVPFSGTDMALQVFQREHITVVQSGTGMFAAVASKELLDRVNKLSSADRNALFYEIKTYYDKELNKAFSSGKGFVDAVNTAVTATAKKYQFILYAGTAGAPLKRMVP